LKVTDEVKVNSRSFGMESDVIELDANSLGSGREQSNETGRQSDREEIVEGRAEGSQQDKRGEQEESKEERVIVEDGVVGRFIIGDFVLLPQHSLILLVARQFAVGQFATQLLANRLFSVLSESMLQLELGVSVREGDGVGGNQGDDRKQHRQICQLHVMHPPVQPFTETEEITNKGLIRTTRERERERDATYRWAEKRQSRRSSRKEPTL
jgi:hypothetical protein